MNNLKRLVKNKYQYLLGFIATYSYRKTPNQIKKPSNLSHKDWAHFLSKNFNKPGCRVLEIGSRNVTGANLRAHFSDAKYVGFDIYPGENVDIVGDVHRLSEYFDDSEKFDLIFSSAVFEHLHMPWVVAEQIQKLLKVGGYVFIETHFSYLSHERPWHFFQFSDMGLRALFNDALGFDLIESGMSNPMVGYFAHNADDYLKYISVNELYCHSEILCRKRSDVEGFDWKKVDLDQIVSGTRYPAPKN